MILFLYGRKAIIVIYKQLRVNTMAVILSLDVGYARMGMALIESEDKTLIDFGVIETYPDRTVEKLVQLKKGPSLKSVKEKVPIQERLKTIYEDLQHLIVHNYVEWLVYEDPFFQRSQNAKPLYATLGIIYLLAAQHNLNLYKYEATTVKEAVTGYGRSDKPIVEAEVRRYFSIPDDTVAIDDAFDAVAVGLTHLLKTQENTHNVA